MKPLWRPVESQDLTKTVTEIGSGRVRHMKADDPWPERKGVSFCEEAVTVSRYEYATLLSCSSKMGRVTSTGTTLILAENNVITGGRDALGQA